ncbi:MAG: M3 family metallopeptidase [Pseudomonadota bacterium]
MIKSNPLTVRTSNLQFNSFDHTHIVEAIDSSLAKANEELEKINLAPPPRTFDNTLLALDNLGVGLDFSMDIVAHLESVATNTEWREAYNSVLPKVTEFQSKLILDEGLWGALTSFAQTPEAVALADHRKRFLDKTIDSFRRSGAELNAADKKRLAEINTELANLTNTFSQHTLDATNAFEYVTTQHTDLSGLPESALDMSRESAAAKNIDGWRFTLQAPSFIAIMTHADSRELREHFYRAYNSRCSQGPLDNRECLKSILKLRSEKAQILGFKDFSDLILADRMAQNGAQASNFVLKLRGHIEPHFKRDNQELFQFVKDSFGVAKDDIKPWDIPYYVEKMRKARYDFDAEDLRPYFPLPHVLKGLFTIVERVFGISVVANQDLQTWDPLVTAYSAFDTKTKALVGHFYADFFPRENKRGGAWMNSLVTNSRVDGPELPHVGLIAGNFSPPNGEIPALLTHDEVTTLFHEFGHLLHLLCNTTELRNQSMSSVAWDFIELPSQILENWCWDRESLALCAAHHQTGEGIPESLFKKMVAARNFRSASHLMRQVGFSTVDLALHREYDANEHPDVVKFARSILSDFAAVPLPEDYSMILTFTHLFSSPVGYAAGYYSYQWAEVLDADAFSRFIKEGLFNCDTGLAFRDVVLSRGDSEDPETLFQRFMGRKADIRPLLERSGLLDCEA